VYILLCRVPYLIDTQDRYKTHNLERALMQPEPIERFSFVTQRLVTDFPPRWKHPNKLIVSEISCPSGTLHNGKIGYTRWAAHPIPAHVSTLAAADHVTISAGYYDYIPVSTDRLALEWHVNFADPRLFQFYGSGLFAQDEMQVAEHPALASVPDAIRSNGGSPITNDQNGPTPILVSGVERRVIVSTDPNLAEGRPYGLYGNYFSSASCETVQRATNVVTNPTVSNIIAMAAPSMGYGRYSPGQIEDVLTIASTAFTAAVSESALIRGVGAKTIVHTGFWGCGAFGGNRVLMAMLQLLAGSISGVDEIVFHSSDSQGTDDVNRSIELIKDKLALPANSNTKVMIANIDSIGFEWGKGDGN
jgi:hypothetical protein